MPRPRALAALAACAGLLAAAAPAQATFPGRNGPIVQAWIREVSADLDEESEHLIAAWSLKRPKGLADPERTVLYGCHVSVSFPYPEGRPSPEEPNPELDACYWTDYSSPAVSPDGWTVVFDAGERLGLVGTDGSDPRFLPERPGVGAPCFAPDGRHIAFTADGQVWISDLRGRHQRPLTTGGGCDWSVRGWIAFFHDRQAFRIRPDGSGKRRLAIRGAQAVSWSPDGRRLAFARERYGRSGTTADSGIFTSDASGGDVRRVLTARDLDGQGYGVRWSPDGRRLLVESGGSLGEVDVRSGRMIRGHGESTGYSGADSRSEGRGYDWGPQPRR